jgi:hypothetical protein
MACPWESIPSPTSPPRDGHRDRGYHRADHPAPAVSVADRPRPPAVWSTAQLATVPPKGNSGESRDRAVETSRVGAWRRLVAHTLGVCVVAGSNPAAPTNLKSFVSDISSELIARLPIATAVESVEA